ncbi:MAG: hypothetical protein ACK43L_06070, partial [Sphingobacteriales bacterium]
MRVTGTFLILTALFFANITAAQTQPASGSRNDTIPAPSVDPELLNIMNAKTPRRYVIQDIKVTGAKYFDPAIVISVSGLAV